jgi:hypothetical protein
MKDTIKLISLVILNYPKDIIKMLNEDGVVVDASNFTTKQLSDATLSGLTTSKKFNNDFVAFVKNLQLSSGYSNGDGDSFGANYGGIISSGLGSLTKFLTLNTETKNLQAQLDAQNKTNETALALKDKEIELERLKLAGGQQNVNNASAKASGNKTLYIALGIGGALILGLVIFAVTRKKS